MRLKEMYEAQKELDRHILEEHPLLFQENRLEKKVLALQVELSEVAQEWRGFKFWSHKQHPTPAETQRCYACCGTGYDGFEPKELEGRCGTCEGLGYIFTKNALLEEYVDCIHFILSIGNDLGVNFPQFDVSRDSYDHTTYGDVEMFTYTGKCVYAILNGGGDTNRYRKAFRAIIMLGYKLGFEWKEVEEYYFKKNAINHERQNNNY